ncbi:MAG: uncharacterized protein KVP18_003502 [Porospora cf. gigantea A]|uniref:uncharacterized protein n=1 Tax=Porospora cf. gigantea A TaxID=2853593 RepID=UPI00355A006D|nr:MAG: hypothetical protein KVP18_003502 [Porospora cf. gigantea A]
MSVEEEILELVPVVIEVGHGFFKIGLGGQTEPTRIVDVFDVEWTEPSEHVDIGKSCPRWMTELESLLRTQLVRAVLSKLAGRLVVLVEDAMCPTALRQALLNVLFSEQYAVGSVYFLPKQLACLYWSTLSTGLVVKVGHGGSSVLPVISGSPVFSALRTSTFGGKTLTALLRYRMVQAESTRFENYSSFDWEDFKVRCVYCAFDLPSGASLRTDQAYQHEDGTEVPAAWRTEGTDALFTRERERSSELVAALEALRAESPSLMDLVLDSLLACSADARIRTVENVVLSGGTTDMNGFRRRFAVELNSLLSASPLNHIKPRVKLANGPISGLLSAWCGGSVVSSLGTNTSTYSREDWVAGHPPHDWTFDTAHVEGLEGYPPSRLELSSRMDTELASHLLNV